MTVGDVCAVVPLGDAAPILVTQPRVDFAPVLAPGVWANAERGGWLGFAKYNSGKRESCYHATMPSRSPGSTPRMVIHASGQAKMSSIEPY